MYMYVKWLGEIELDYVTFSQRLQSDLKRYALTLLFKKYL